MDIFIKFLLISYYYFFKIVGFISFQFKIVHNNFDIIQSQSFRLLSIVLRIILLCFIIITLPDALKAYALDLDVFINYCSILENSLGVLGMLKLIINDIQCPGYIELMLKNLFKNLQYFKSRNIDYDFKNIIYLYIQLVSSISVYFVNVPFFIWGDMKHFTIYSYTILSINVLLSLYKVCVYNIYIIGFLLFGSIYKAHMKSILILISNCYCELNEEFLIKELLNIIKIYTNVNQIQTELIAYHEFELF